MPKCSEYDATTNLKAGDLFLIAQDAGGGTYTTKKITKTNLLAALDAELAAFAGRIRLANKLPYFTGSGAAARQLLDDADAATIEAYGVDEYLNQIVTLNAADEKALAALCQSAWDSDSCSRADHAVSLAGDLSSA
jgi:hypothetical protein